MAESKMADFILELLPTTPMKMTTHKCSTPLRARAPSRASHDRQRKAEHTVTGFRRCGNLTSLAATFLKKLKSAHSFFSGRRGADNDDDNCMPIDTPEPELDSDAAND